MWALPYPLDLFGHCNLQKGSSGIIAFVQMEEKLRLGEERLCAHGPLASPWQFWNLGKAFGPLGNTALSPSGLEQS